VSWAGFDRRLHVRHLAKQLVRIDHLPGRPAHESIIGHLVDLSVGGFSARFDKPSELKIKQRMRATIVVNFGSAAKPHFRHAMVMHITQGVVGFAMSLWTAEDSRKENITWST
jgi:c-di-GMP-binding flagellar brake protein YcgR